MKHEFWAALCAVVLAGAACCTPSRTAREVCYAKTELAAEQRIVTECPGKWSTCPAHDAIMADLRDGYAGCP